MKRFAVGILLIVVACALDGGFRAAFGADKQGAAPGSGPAMGKWAFEGKDDKGVVWKGTLTVRELDTKVFDAYRYNATFALEAESADSANGVYAPSTWNPAKRLISFGTGSREAYTAVLSPDGKSMIQGKWTESDIDPRTRKMAVVRTGVWSAEYLGP